MGVHETCPAIGERSLVALAAAGPVPLAPGEFRVVRSAAEAEPSGPVLVEVAEVAQLAELVGGPARSAPEGCVGVWTRDGLDPAESVRVAAAAGLCRTAGPQLVLRLDTGPGPDAVLSQLVDVARRAEASGLPPQLVAASVLVGPGDDVAGLLLAWRADPLAARHPFVVIPSSTLTRAERLGVTGRALLERAAVATDDVRGARRMLEVVTAIDAHRCAARPAELSSGAS